VEPQKLAAEQPSKQFSRLPARQSGRLLAGLRARRLAGQSEGDLFRLQAPKFSEQLTEFLSGSLARELTE
jgi:hypothetical protein